jgi:hypothetical protein
MMILYATFDGEKNDNSGNSRSYLCIAAKCFRSRTSTNLKPIPIKK